MAKRKPTKAFEPGLHKRLARGEYARVIDQQGKVIGRVGRSKGGSVVIDMPKEWLIEPEVKK